MIVSVIAGSMTAPKMMFASFPASSKMMDVASSTSINVRSGPPVMFTNTPCAPEMEALSSNGLEMACWDAKTARSSPLAVPVPITASPMFFMTVSTSAKSRLINPWTLMRSEMPLDAWCRIESASLNASTTVVLLSTMDMSFWFGIVITVSHAFRNSVTPANPRFMRFGPSKLKGIVTTPTVNIPISRAN